MLLLKLMTGRHPLYEMVNTWSNAYDLQDHLHNKRTRYVDISDLKQRGTPDARNAADTLSSCVVSMHQPHPVDRPIIKDVVATTKTRYAISQHSVY